MNYCKNTISFLEDALGSSLTPTQKTMVYLHSSLALEPFDVASFALENHLSPSMSIAKLASFGKKVLTFWDEALPEKINEYQENVNLLINDLSDNQDKSELDFLENQGFSNIDIKDALNNMSNVMVKALSENKKLVTLNLEYLIKLGVSNYREIFKQYYELFLLDYSNFDGIFNKYDQEDLVDKLEKNIAIIEYL